MAFSISGEFDLDQLLRRCIPLFLRKLNCILAAVVRTSPGQVRTEYVVPHAMRASPEYQDLVNRLLAETPSDACGEVLRLNHDGAVYYGFGLKGFGLLILGREKPFEEFFLKEFVFLCRMLERACLACVEVDRRVAAELAERRMRESLVRIRALFEQAAVGVARIDMATGRFVQVNQRLCEILGYSRRELESLDERSLTHVEDPALEQSDAEKSEFTQEKRYLRKDGAAVWVTVTISPLWLDGARSPYHIAIVQDITERKRVEEALRRSEQQIQRVLDSIVAGVFLIDAETHTILDVNESAARQVRLAKSEIVGKPCHRFVYPSECGRCRVSDLGHTVERSERVLLQADGTPIPVIKSITEGVVQGRACLIESFVDIREQKRAEAELKESLSLVEATLESTADGILVVDGQGKIKNFNQQFQDLWRLPNEILEKRDDDAALAAALPHLAAPDAFLSRVKELYAAPEQKGDGVLHFRDGRVVEYYSSPQCLGDRIVGRVWSFRDVTTAYGARQEQEKLLHQVAAINEELTHFAYVVSHDLKAPLRGIKMLAEWLYEDYIEQFDGEARESLQLLQNRVERMHSLIEGVLQYSRVGRIKEDLVEVDLEALLADIIDAIAPPEHIRIHVEGALPTIVCEKTRITQVFQNLLTNAVKYMDKPAGEITIACTQDDEGWTFRVGDNGCGIEEKYFDRIFKIFQTLAPRDAFESTGVGLTLVKKIVEHYGGRIWLASEVGKGTTFFFTLPLSKTPAAEAMVQITESVC